MSVEGSDGLAKQVKECHFRKGGLVSQEWIACMYTSISIIGDWYWGGGKYIMKFFFHEGTHI
jgi:hypothetical protein